VPPSALPLAGRMQSKCIAHRGLESAINCYAEDERTGGGTDDLEGLPAHLIRFASRYNALHARYARAAASVSRNTIGARCSPCKMQLKIRRRFLGKYIRALLSLSLIYPFPFGFVSLGTYYRVRAETAGVASERTIYISMQMHSAFSRPRLSEVC